MRVTIDDFDAHVAYDPTCLFSRLVSSFRTVVESGDTWHRDDLPVDAILGEDWRRAANTFIATGELTLPPVLQIAADMRSSMLAHAGTSQSADADGDIQMTDGTAVRSDDSDMMAAFSDDVVSMRQHACDHGLNLPPDGDCAAVQDNVLRHVLCGECFRTSSTYADVIGRPPQCARICSAFPSHTTWLVHFLSVAVAAELPFASLESIVDIVCPDLHIPNVKHRRRHLLAGLHTKLRELQGVEPGPSSPRATTLIDLLINSLQRMLRQELMDTVNAHGLELSSDSPHRRELQDCLLFHVTSGEYLLADDNVSGCVSVVNSESNHMSAAGVESADNLQTLRCSNARPPSVGPGRCC